MINLITQPDPKTGCGVAIYAMLMNISYEEALVFAKENNFCKLNLLVTIKQMKEALFTIVNKNVKSKNVLLWNESENYVCFCRYDNSPTKHWILYYDGVFYDPLLKNTKKWPLCEVIRIIEI